MTDIALLHAATQGDIDTVQAMLRSEPALAVAHDKYAKTGLHLAVEFKQPAIAILFLAAGAAIEARTSWGATPLDWAGVLGRAEIGNLLVARGARVHLPSAAGIGRLDLVRSFWPDGRFRLEGAACMRFREENKDQWVALPPSTDEHEIASEAFYLAARNGQLRIVEFLLARGADINCRGFFGAPGLHWASINGHEAMVEYLLERGADKDIRDTQFDGDAWNWARQGGHAEIVQLLEDKQLS